LRCPPPCRTSHRRGRHRGCLADEPYFLFCHAESGGQGLERALIAFVAEPRRLIHYQTARRLNELPDHCQIQTSRRHAELRSPTQLRLRAGVRICAANPFTTRFPKNTRRAPTPLDWLRSASLRRAGKAHFRIEVRANFSVVSLCSRSNRPLIHRRGARRCDPECAPRAWLLYSVHSPRRKECTHTGVISV
jgi:hypothetical protein